MSKTADKNSNIRLLEKPSTVLNYYRKIGWLLPVGISCTFKCKGCINKQHKDEYIIMEYNVADLIQKYQENVLAESIIIAGLEPFDNIPDLTLIIDEFRQVTSDDIVIYTGYDIGDIIVKYELIKLTDKLCTYDNIIVKYGRYKEHSKAKWCEELGIWLKSDNQWAIRMGN